MRRNGGQRRKARRASNAQKQKLDKPGWVTKCISDIEEKINRTRVDKTMPEEVPPSPEPKLYRVGGLCGESDATGPSIFARMHNGASTRLEAAMAAQNWLRPPWIERFSPQNGPVGQARNDGSCPTQFCDPKNFECFGELNGLRPGTVPPDSPGDVLYGKLAFLKPAVFICESFAALVQGDVANVAPMETHSTMELVHEVVGVHEFQGYSQEEQYCPTGHRYPDGSTTIADFAGGSSVKGGNQVEQSCPTGSLCPNGSMVTVRKPSMDAVRGAQVCDTSMDAVRGTSTSGDYCATKNFKGVSRRVPASRGTCVYKWKDTLIIMKQGKRYHRAMDIKAKLHEQGIESQPGPSNKIAAKKKMHKKKEVPLPPKPFLTGVGGLVEMSGVCNPDSSGKETKEEVPPPTDLY